jgi:bis(5'-nucleosyl)-tetraphosphatase (symmetrical)
MATFAIGDIQGCFAEFQELLALSGFREREDRLWLVGDLVNRGPQSLETLRYVRSLGSSAVTVLGNHDLHLLAVSEGLEKPREGDTLDEVLSAPDRDELLAWLRLRPLLHCERGMVLVHAGLLPQWDIATASRLAAEVEIRLRSPNYRQFLSRLYGGKPDHWSDSLQGMDRLRVIVNAMTRLRFCSVDGVMEFRSKGEVNQNPPGYMPWFDVPGRRSLDAAVVFGHWSALGLKLTNKLIAIDSGCVWGGQLTAVRLDDRQLFQVPCRASLAGSFE